MAFDGNEGEVVQLTDAADWTASHRATMGTGDLKGQFYGKNKIMQILNQNDCVGIRIYHGIDSNGTKIMILVGAKANEDDIDSGVIVEQGSPCPPRCGSKNSLNS